MTIKDGQGGSSVKTNLCGCVRNAPKLIKIINTVTFAFKFILTLGTTLKQMVKNGFSVKAVINGSTLNAKLMQEILNYQSF